MAQPIKLSISTQIRNIYSDKEGSACLNMRFYNNVLSLSWYPFTGKDNNGRNQYDSRHGQQSTINYEAAFGLYQLGNDIINGKINECTYTIPCLGATIIFERKLGPTGYETNFSITKNNVTIVFTFPVVEYLLKDNNTQETKQLEVGLGAFVKTIEGFLTGINSDRHLDKLTESFAQAQESNKNNNTPAPRSMNPMADQNPFQQQQPQQNSYNRQYNNNRRNYNPNRQYNNWGGLPQQMSNYNLPN